MVRLAIFSLLTAAAAAQESPRRVLDAGRYHLGVAGNAEWQEFEASPPHGPQLDLPFTARTSELEATLFVRQRDVRANWNVLVNGRKVGALEPLGQPLVVALAIPAGTLIDGDNRLTIMRTPSRVVDDIEITGIALEARPRDEALGEATLEVSVVDADTRRALPCRLTLVDTSAALTPLRATSAGQLAIRTGVVYTGDGRARITTQAGSYTLYASRGFEYGVATRVVTLGAGGREDVALSVRREVPTPGLVACDTHIHTLTFSRHGDATLAERMITIAGEGIELAVATDHNHHADYTEAAAQAGVAAHFTPVIGNEVTTSAGHFNAFPVPAGGPVPDAKLTDWPELLHNIRRVTGARVITLNHPRDLHSNFVPLGSENFDAATGELKKAPKFDCDAIEVVTSAALQSDVMLLFRDWFALLNHGYRVAAIGASDTHHVSEFILGQARTYAACGATEPTRIDVGEVCDAYRKGRLLVSMGLLTQMTVNGRFGVGDLATGLGENLNITVTVLGPSWARADRLELFANGIKVREQSIADTDRVEKARVTWTLPRPKHDMHLVAIATGPGVKAPFWEVPRPYQASSKVPNPRIVGSTNPIWIDGDADGKFTAALDYAAQIVRATDGDRARLQVALVGYDNAVATQAAALMRKK